MKRAIAWGLAAIFATTFFFLFFILLDHDFDWQRIRSYQGNFLHGWVVTVLVSSGALILSILLGALLTAGQLSPLGPTRWLARGWVELIRGTPLLTQILIGYYLVADRLGLHGKFWIGVVLLAVFSASYLSEIFRAGIESIPRSQFDSARAVGFTLGQTYRFVVIPQGMRRVLPATAGQFANLIKDSSLLYVIGLQELTMQSRAANAATYATFESFIPMAIGYLILTLPISFGTRYLEKRFRYET